jgi:hypothetical protein
MKRLRFLFSGIASEQGLPENLDNREDLRPAGFIPCQDDPGHLLLRFKDFGMVGPQTRTLG